MKLYKLLFAVFLCCWLSLGTANAGVDLLLGANYFNPGFNDTASSVVTVDPGIGALVGLGYVSQEKGSGFEINLLYSQLSYELTILTIKTEFAFNYLQIPLMYRFTGDSTFIQLGAYYALGIDGTATINNIELDFANQADDYGLVVGAGLMMGTNLSLGARFYFGLSDLDSGSGNEVISQTISALLAYRF